MAFKPSRLGLRNSATVEWQNSGYSLTGEYNWEFDGPANISIANPTLDGCKINFTANSNVPEGLKSDFHLKPKDIYGDDLDLILPVTFHSNDGFYPTNNSIISYSSGGFYTVSYYSTSQMQSWTVNVKEGLERINTRIEDWDSSYVSFSITVTPGSNVGTGVITISGIKSNGQVLSPIDYNITLSDSNVILDIYPETNNIDASAGISEFNLTVEGKTFKTINAVCAGSTDITTDIENETVEVTVPENTTVVDKEYVVYINATTSEDDKVFGIAYINQSKTFFNLSQTVYNVDWIANKLNITGTGSNNLNITFDILPADKLWIKNPTHYIRNGSVYISMDISANTSSKSRSAVVQLKYNNNQRINITINQPKQPIIQPIWKDYIWSEETASWIEYHLDYQNNVLYSGKAYPYPGSNNVSFIVNSVAENYLSNWLNFPNTYKTYVMPEYLKYFDLKTSTGKEQPFVFFNDWSYKDRILTRGSILSDPISNLIDNRQYLVSSWLIPINNNNDNIVFRYRNSVLGISGSEGVNGYVFVNNLKNYTFPCNTELKIQIYKVATLEEELVYKIDSSNKDYVLYYVNAAGGWDSLLVEGNVKKTDNIQSETYTQRVLDTSTSFSKNKYLNTITSSWVLYTGYLNDIQASKMYNLLESNQVYLHNLKEDVITPVIITNSTCEYLTYTNNGKKKFYYTINVEASQDKYRK